MSISKVFHGTGVDLQAAMLAAHDAYSKEAHKADPSKDMFTTKVVSFGVETGGFVRSTTFFADVQETPHPSAPQSEPSVRK